MEQIDDLVFLHCNTKRFMAMSLNTLKGFPSLRECNLCSELPQAASVKISVLSSWQMKQDTKSVKVGQVIRLFSKENQCYISVSSKGKQGAAATPGIHRDVR